MLLNYLTKKHKIRRIKKIMRGYSYLRNINQLDLITKIKDSISRVNFNDSFNSYSNIVFGKQTNNAFIIVNQYLFNRIGGLNFNSAILYYFGNSNSPIIYPLPLHWQKVLTDYNIKVDKFKSLILWYILVIFLFGYGILVFTKFFLEMFNRFSRNLTLNTLILFILKI